jgi:hypothetical protein
MRFVLYHGIVTRLEIRASEKHEMENGARNSNPPICTGCKGNRRTEKCSEMHK